MVLEHKKQIAVFGLGAFFLATPLVQGVGMLCFLLLFIFLAVTAGPRAMVQQSPTVSWLLAIAYLVFVFAELLSPNTLEESLTTVVNYLPLLVFPLALGGVRALNIDLKDLARPIVVTMIALGILIFVEFLFQSPPRANANPFDSGDVNPIPFALYALLISVAAYFLWRQSLMASWAVFVCVLVGSMLVLLSGSRGVWLTLGVVLSVTAVVESVVLRRWVPLLVPLVAGVLGLAAVLAVPDLNQRVMQSVEELRILSSVQMEQSSMSMRVAAWVSGYQLGWESPIFGWGNQDNIALASARASVELPSFRVLSHFHNSFIDHWVMFGGMGLVAFALGAFSLPVALLLSAGRRSAPALVLAINVALALALYSLFDRLLDSDVTSSIMLFGWLIMGLALSSQSAEKPLSADKGS